jgi:hypothetical protein
MKFGAYSEVLVRHSESAWATENHRTDLVVETVVANDVELFFFFFFFFFFF